MEQSVTEQVVFFQFALGQSGCEVGTVNRNVEFFQNVGQRAKVVLMSVSKDYGSNVLAVLFKKIEVRNTDIDAVGRLFGKPHAGVQDKHLILITHSHTIHSKLADTAERNNLQDTTHLRLLLNSPGVGQTVNSLAVGLYKQGSIACAVQTRD